MNAAFQMGDMVGPRGSGRVLQCKEQPDKEIQDYELITKDLMPALLKQESNQASRSLHYVLQPAKTMAKVTNMLTENRPGQGNKAEKEVLRLTRNCTIRRNFGHHVYIIIIIKHFML